jgi:septal ring factor EnvC (AmiA/AmiB activator)
MKALTLVLCILALLGSAASGYFWWEIGNTKKELQSQLSSEQARATSLQGSLAQTNESLEKTNTKLAESDAALGDAKRNLTAAEARNVQTARDLDAAKRTLAAKEDAEKKLNSDLDALRRELVQTRLAAQVGSPEELEVARKTISGLETRLAELQGLPPPAASTEVAAASTAAPAKPALSERTSAARVAQVGVKNAFVVLDLGTADGITVGNRFVIKRGEDQIAESVISDVKESFSIAQVVPGSIKSTLKAGDTASYRN